MLNLSEKDGHATQKTRTPFHVSTRIPGYRNCYEYRDHAVVFLFIASASGWCYGYKLWHGHGAVYPFSAGMAVRAIQTA